jgi:hypothetical protein
MLSSLLIPSNIGDNDKDNNDDDDDIVQVVNSAPHARRRRRAPGPGRAPGHHQTQHNHRPFSGIVNSTALTSSLSRTMTASSWWHIDPGSGAVMPDHRGGTTAPLPRLWTRAMPSDAVIIHPDVQVALESPPPLVPDVLSRCPHLLPCQPLTILLPSKI